MHRPRDGITNNHMHHASDDYGNERAQTERCEVSDFIKGKPDWNETTTNVYGDIVSGTARRNSGQSSANP